MTYTATEISFLLILISWVTSACFCMWLADNKGYIPELWLLLGLIGGIVGLIALAERWIIVEYQKEMGSNSIN